MPSHTNPLAKTQNDLIEPRDVGIREENVVLPGLQAIPQMSEQELVDFFTVMLKTRRFIRSVELKLGSYEYTARPCNIPGVENSYQKPTDHTARLLAQVMQQNPNVCGFYMGIDVRPDGTGATRIETYTADKQPQGPKMIKGKKEAGDDEFSPELKIAYYKV